MIEDISFIVIARNEQFAIDKCLNSIVSMNLSNCEVICIDSDSTDNTVSIIRSYKDKIANLRLFQVKGYVNAAIARNVGIRHATRKCVFFVDGDIELNENFISVALTMLGDGFPAITGDLEEIQYSACYNKVITRIKSRNGIKKESKVFASGGNFLIMCQLILDIGTFNERFEINEDWELTLRITRKYPMLALPVSMGIHHTVPYHNNKRIMNSLARMHPVYMGMILRRNIMNYSGLKYLMRKSLRGVLLGACIILAIIIILFALPSPFKYVGALFLVGSDLVYGLYQKKDIYYRLLVHYVYPFLLLYGVCFDVDPRKAYSVQEI